MTRELIAVDLALTFAAAALWIAAAVVGLTPSQHSPRRRRLLALVLAVLGSAAILARVAVVAALAMSGWWFVEEKVLLAVPLALVAAGTGLGAASRELRSSTERTLSVRSSTALIAGAAGATAAIAIQFVVGSPLTPVAAGSTLSIVGLGIVLIWLVLARRARRQIVGAAALVTLCLLVTAGWTWTSDRVSWSAIENVGGHHGQAAPETGVAPTVSVADIRTPLDRVADTHVVLTARQQEVTLPSGRTVSAWTFGSLPGPELRVSQGDLVEVVLTNRDITAGVTIHWHGYDLPNGDDGVAGVTQDAVLPGGTFTYRFVANQAGTYWYHSHQASAEGVVRGLYGSLVVEPTASEPADVDLVVPFHELGGSTLLGSSDTSQSIRASAGDLVRLRVINTAQHTERFALDGAEFRIGAVDGRDLAGAGAVTGELLRIPAGGRYDLEFRMPATPVTLTAEDARDAPLVVATAIGATPDDADFTAPEFDLIAYGTGGLPELGPPTAHETLVLDRQLRVLASIPRLAYTVNGAVYPNIAPTVVAEGDVVVFTVVNRSTESHPMHPHGHHVLVMSRDGVAPQTALWLDTVDVQPGEVWVFALVADNPGIWMDHCHNLEHAAEGMMFSLSYAGVSSPFRHGGEHGNRSE